MFTPEQRDRTRARLLPRAEAAQRWTAWIYEEFGARGPRWRTVFGTPHAQPPFAPPDRNTLIGFAWHRALRDQLIALACLRLDLPTTYSKGAHLRPDEVTAATAELDLSAPELANRLRPMLLELT
ncbi:hypothetical protein [Streptomyces sp. NPDC002276]